MFRLEPLSPEAITRVVELALRDSERGFGRLPIEINADAMNVWCTRSDGDARRALNALEVGVLSGIARQEREGGRALVIDRLAAEDSIQQKTPVYDGTGDGHYDHASAFIKSIRGSDPDAALYWLASMLHAGEDPRFIARRLSILASEDIGNADPRAIMIASATFTLVERIGMPEARITLAQAVTYLALAPKSNASYTAIEGALEDVREGRSIAVPVYLRDPNSSPVSQNADGTGVRTAAAPGEKYQYSHGAMGGVTGQDYLGVDREYYHPTQSGAEQSLRERLDEIRRVRNVRRVT
jgi:putative ATPase